MVTWPFLGKTWTSPRTLESLAANKKKKTPALHERLDLSVTSRSGFSSFVVLARCETRGDGGETRSGQSDAPRGWREPRAAAIVALHPLREGDLELVSPL